MKTSTGPACGMRRSRFSQKPILLAGSCPSPGSRFHFQNLSHPLALADALQQPQQKPKPEEVRGCPAVPSRRQPSGRTGQSRWPLELLCSLPASLVYSPSPKMHENCMMFELIHLQCQCAVRVLVLPRSLGF